MSASSSSSEYLEPGKSYALLLRLRDNDPKARRGWVKGFVQCDVSDERKLSFVYLFFLTADEIQIIKTRRFKLTPGTTNSDLLDMTVPGQAMVYVSETMDEGISAEQLRERAQKTLHSFKHITDLNTPAYEDTMTIIATPELVLLSALRRGLVVPVNEEDLLASKLKTIAIIDKAAD